MARQNRAYHLKFSVSPPRRHTFRFGNDFPLHGAMMRLNFDSDYLLTAASLLPSVVALYDAELDDVAGMNCSVHRRS